MVAITFLHAFYALILTASVSTVLGLVVVGPQRRVNMRTTSRIINERLSSLSMSSGKVPKHDVGGGTSWTQLPDDQRERMEKFMEHQNSVPKLGYPVDVRSLVQYNHGFAVMSTNSKSYVFFYVLFY
jgi:hypothetical protein